MTDSDDEAVLFADWITTVSSESDMDRVCKWLVQEDGEEVKVEPVLS
jgi:hypothetical protein